MAKPPTIQAGYCVAVHLLPETAPEDCYIGVVENTDEYGILINLVHWDDKLDMLGGYTESLFIPWMNINSMLVSTEVQPTRRFMADRARKWKEQISAMYGKAGTTTKKK
ncbi:MAG: hypothetical protein A2Y89_02255 [Chloroflexi bacterium RBG_13_51_18]|nr:MAG: hypothetical protein A2Y89_02255 [Chloroflexi bacterium RBG_13_51_18]